ncbi:YcxB family protein [Streptomyces sp. NPDC005435]|uniref:YcxB family protein n=1 Tax=Streptomyces sp. NPDC005435 TaxID=3154464 RepID=UPI0034525AD6
MEREPEAVEETAGDVVELTYRLEAADLTSALRARLRVSRTGWVFFWAPGVVLGVFVIQVALYVAGFHQHISLGSMITMLILTGVLPLSPWLTGRRLARYTGRQGVFRATVTDAGVTLVTDTTTATVTWQAQPRYRETPRAFVLFSGDANATGFTLLPKQGLPDRADADRLRAILDRHLVRC